MRIKGSATLAFSPDLKWFQGNILGEAEEVYTITGRLRRVSNTVILEEEEAELTGRSDSLDIAGGPQLGSSVGAPASEGCDQQLTPPSEADSLDSELVRVAMESLGLEEEGLTYTVSIMDYETGTNHALEVNYIIINISHHILWFSVSRMCAAISCLMFVIYQMTTLASPPLAASRAPGPTWSSSETSVRTSQTTTWLYSR